VVHAPNVGLQIEAVEQAQSAVRNALQPLDGGRPVGSGKAPGSPRAAPSGHRSHGKGSGSNNSSGNGSGSGAKPLSPPAANGAGTSSSHHGSGNQQWLNGDAASAAVLSALSGPPEPHSHKVGVSSSSSVAAADLARDAMHGL